VEPMFSTAAVEVGEDFGVFEVEHPLFQREETVDALFRLEPGYRGAVDEAPIENQPTHDTFADGLKELFDQRFEMGRLRRVSWEKSHARCRVCIVSSGRCG